RVVLRGCCIWVSARFRISDIKNLRHNVAKRFDTNATGTQHTVRGHSAIYDRRGVLLTALTFIDVYRYRITKRFTSCINRGSRRLTVAVSRRNRYWPGLLQNMLGLGIIWLA